MQYHLLFALCLLALACSEAEPVPANPPGRVLIIGIDGASPERIGPMLAAGRLPHLKQLAESGVSGPLRSLTPILSPRIWTSVATGVLPEHHGIENWTKEEGDSRRLYNSHDRRVHALWNIVSDAGLSVATVNWLMTYPAEPVAGAVISDLAFPGTAAGRIDMWTREDVGDIEREKRARAIEELGPVTYPQEWPESIELAAKTAGVALTDIPDPFSDNESIQKRARRELPRLAYQKDSAVVRLALEVEERVQPQVMMVLLQGIDRASHWLWGGFEPAEIYQERKRPSSAEQAAYREALLAYYDYTDALVGLLMERFGEDDLILVLSDHGFEGGNHGYYRMTGVHDSERALDGVLFGRGVGIAAGASIPTKSLHVQDIAPTVLAWLGLPVAKNMDGSPADFLMPVQPLRWIDSYETKPVPRLPFEASAAEGEMLEELRRLGYIE